MKTASILILTTVIAVGTQSAADAAGCAMVPGAHANPGSGVRAGETEWTRGQGVTHSGSCTDASGAAIACAHR